MALAGLDRLLSIAPANDNLRLSRAAIARWRGWPRSSAREFGLMLHGDDSLGKGVHTTQLLLEQQEFQPAEQALAQAQQIEPLDKAVLDAQKSWRHYSLGEFENQCDHGTFGRWSARLPKVFKLDASYFTAPVHYNFSWIC